MPKTSCRIGKMFMGTPTKFANRTFSTARLPPHAVFLLHQSFSSPFLFENFFVAKKRKHNDVKWRNMGWDNKKNVVVYDLGSVEKCGVVVGLKRPFKS